MIIRTRVVLTNAVTVLTTRAGVTFPPYCNGINNPSKCHIPTLLNRRLQDIKIIMYKVKFNICPKYICDMLLRNFSTYNLRVKEFQIPRFNTVGYGKHFLRYLGGPCCGPNYHSM